MNAATKTLSVKVFAGFPLVGEFKIELSQSKEWNLLKILPSNHRKKLQIARGEGIEHIGFYLPDAPQTVTQLHKIEQELRELIASLCPKLHPNKLHLKLFTQTLIS